MTRIDAMDIAAALERLRRKAPLVQNITNYVVMEGTANALLAIGAAPAMVHAAEEVEDFVAISSALVINIGTLSPGWVAGMKLAIHAAHARGVRWVLDPVGVGATRYRSAVAAELVALKPAVIRANASEIMALAGAASGPTRGVDATDGTDAALAPAKQLARASGAVVAMTGAVDYATDGTRVVSFANGSPLMARVTGMGCAATALVGAFLGSGLEPFEAAAAAIGCLGVAGEIAAEGAAGPGSFHPALLDALASLDETVLAARLKHG